MSRRHADTGRQDDGQTGIYRIPPELLAGRAEACRGALQQRKQELELTIEHRQAELDKAKQELRDFLATLKQLMEESV